MLPELVKESRGHYISFNRSDDSFKAIRNFYLTGKLHMPLNLCPGEFAEEMDYWGIRSEILEPCCRYRFLRFKQQEEMSRQFRETIPSAKHPGTISGEFSCRQRLWFIIDNRESSVLAKIYLGIILLFVFLSLASLSLSTLPKFQRKLTICEARDLMIYDHYVDDDVEEYLSHNVHCNDDADEALKSILGDYAYYTDEKFNETIQLWNSQWNTSSEIEYDIDDLKFKWKLKQIKIPNKTARLKEFDLIDQIVLVVFSVDLILRLATCPSIFSYYKSALNVIDTIVLVCGILGYALEKSLIDFTFDRGDLDILVYLQQLRVFRLLRVVQNVAAIKVLAFCFKANFKEILVLILFLFVGVNFFANVLYFVEQKHISSIPQAWWWGIITMTTVGYGDLYPVTAVGRIIGSFCALCGVIVLALIIPLFVNNFIALYEMAHLFENNELEEQKLKTLQVKVRPT
ncbi:potassium voltage-gated channel subfamily B member 2-like [Saccostrea echinata]|uniref:potassium voltage-gated channel subfamily B member 2-like n=1 Tax=Saccostrea echinata TaxID=191078 RepID=UPI002A827902|nr:potassium voltage-gated channel subfamily B member 2-like [Saccostrea echinata]